MKLCNMKHEAVRLEPEESQPLPQHCREHRQDWDWLCGTQRERERGSHWDTEEVAVMRKGSLSTYGVALAGCTFWNSYQFEWNMLLLLLYVICQRDQNLSRLLPGERFPQTPRRGGSIATITSTYVYFLHSRPNGAKWLTDDLNRFLVVELFVPVEHAEEREGGQENQAYAEEHVSSERRKINALEKREGKD